MNYIKLFINKHGYNKKAMRYVDVLTAQYKYDMITLQQFITNLKEYERDL